MLGQKAVTHANILENLDPWCPIPHPG